MPNTRSPSAAADTTRTLAIQNPYLDWLGVRLAEWREGYAEMHLHMVPTLGNRTGRVHGGVICSLLDSVAGYSGSYSHEGETPRHCVTLSLTTQFLDSAEGKLLIANGRTEKVGRTIFFARSEVWLDDERLLASASGTFKYVRHHNRSTAP